MRAYRYDNTKVIIILAALNQSFGFGIEILTELCGHFYINTSMSGLRIVNYYLITCKRGVPIYLHSIHI